MRVFQIVPAVFAGLVLPAGIAAAGPKFEGPNGMTFDYYGQLNGAYVSVDDGFGTESYVGDNGTSPSRFGFNIRNDFGGTEFRFNFETALGFPSTGAYDNNPATSDPTFDWTQEDLRKVDVSLSNPTWGRISAGQGTMASDDSAEQDLSGTTMTTYTGFRSLAGGFQFRNAANGALSGVDIGDAFDNFDGNSRKGRVRYDTPTFAGFVLSASYGQEILKHNVDDDY